MARKKKPWDELRSEAADRGFITGRYSPGDGVTRYRFFDKKEIRRKFGVKGVRSQDYFGPGNGVCTALGLKKAFRFLHTGECK